MMRAKVSVLKVTPYGEPPTSVVVEMAPVCDKPFGPEGESEDNTFARWTPSGSISLTITNPSLLDKFQEGQRFYVDFVHAKPQESPAAAGAETPPASAPAANEAAR